MQAQAQALPWLAPGQDFPPVGQAWPQDSGAPGLLAAGGALDIDTLQRAYRQGIFPWYSQGQPVLWWSPDPRMVLGISHFRLHRSLKKTLQRFRKTTGCEIRIDSAFSDVILACATGPRKDQAGSWIVPDMVAAYCGLHQAGFAHSVETWVNGKLVGGLYCVSQGRFVFGESMFSRTADASKIALAALVCFCRRHGIGQIDCQQNTGHLNSLGASEVPRDRFVEQLAAGIAHPAPPWKFDPLYWRELLPSESTKM